MRLGKVAKAIAKPFIKIQRWRQFNGDIEAIRIGGSSAYPLNWELIRNRYLKDERTLRVLLQGLAKVKYAGNSRFRVFFPPKTRIHVEKMLNLPNGITATQLAIVQDKELLNETERILKKPRNQNNTVLKGSAAELRSELEKLEASLDSMIRQAIETARES